MNDALTVAGYDTPESVPDVFGQAPTTTFGSLTGAGFRGAGAGGLANIASILGANGITFKQPDDSDDDEDVYQDNKGLDNDLKPMDVTVCYLAYG
jgi:protein phosphatase 2C family protein 2/3